MNLSLLSRHQRPKRRSIQLFEGADLEDARVHECSGVSKHLFALLVAQKTQGPVFWISLTHRRDHINPQGFQSLISPHHFIFITAKRHIDALWSMEEALRSPAPRLVVADVDTYPALTPTRRLHLAAEHGNTLGLLLTPQTGGAQGIETRWHMTPQHSPSQQSWHLSRTKARGAPPQNWTLIKSDTTTFEVQSDIQRSATH